MRGRSSERPSSLRASPYATHSGTDPISHQASSRTLLLPVSEERKLVEVDGLAAGAAAAVPTAQQWLQECNGLRQRQAGRGAFGHSRSSVRKACAHVMSAQWWWKPG